MATVEPEVFGARNALRMVRRELDRAINAVATDQALVPMLEQEALDWRTLESESNALVTFAASRGLDQAELRFVYYMVAAEDSTWRRAHLRLLDASQDRWSLRALMSGRGDRLTGQFLDSLIVLDTINSYDFNETRTPARWRTALALQERAPERWFQARRAARRYSDTLQLVLEEAEAASAGFFAADDSIGLPIGDRERSRSIEPVFIADALSLDIDSDFARWSALEPESLVLSGGEQASKAFGGTDPTSGVVVRLSAAGAAWRVTVTSRGARGRFDVVILFASGKIASAPVDLEEGGHDRKSIPVATSNDRPVRFEVLKRDH